MTTAIKAESGSLSVTINVPLEKVLGLLVHGLDDTHSWMHVDEFVDEFKLPTGFQWPDWTPDWAKKYDAKMYMAPLIAGGSITIVDHEDEDEAKYKITLDSVKRGLEVFAAMVKDKGGHHFHDFMQENDDAITGYVFLQCCAFPEEVAEKGMRYT